MTDDPPKLDDSMPPIGVNELILTVKLDGGNFMPKIAFDTHGSAGITGQLLGSASYILERAFIAMAASYTDAGDRERLQLFVAGFNAASGGAHAIDHIGRVLRRDGA